MRIITFDRGSKRRLRQIRWTWRERTSITLLCLFLLAFCILYVHWELSGEHPFVGNAMTTVRSNAK